MLKPTLIPYYKEASLIISHAGAGTILEVLKMKKKLICVVNESLMHNHQVEIAEKLAEMNKLVYACSVKKLSSNVCF